MKLISIDVALPRLIVLVLVAFAFCSHAATLQERQHELAAEDLARGIETDTGTRLDPSIRTKFTAIYSGYSKERLELWERECAADLWMRARSPDAKDQQGAERYLTAVIEINAKRLDLAHRIDRDLRLLLLVEQVASVVTRDRARFQFPTCPGAGIGTR